MNISEAFGKRLKTVRTQAGLSQPELAKLCGWDSQSRLSNYERGERTPSLDDIDKLSRALDISICQLISNESHAINEDPALYQADIINDEIKEVIIYTIKNQLNDYYKNLPSAAQVSLIFELYNSAYKDRALLDATKNMQASTLIKMLTG